MALMILRQVHPLGIVSELTLVEKIKVDKNADDISSDVRTEVREIFNVHVEKLTTFYSFNH